MKVRWKNFEGKEMVKECVRVKILGKGHVMVYWEVGDKATTRFSPVDEFEIIID